MGTSPSKEKVTSSQKRGSSATVNTLNTYDGEEMVCDGKKCKKDKKKKSKNKPINERRSPNIKEKGKHHEHGGCGGKKSITFEEHVICNTGRNGGNPQIYRKKSACPSCEATDMILDQLRERSGSIRSLRYSDFNKIIRQSRISDLDEKVTEIPLDGVEEPLPEKVCFICGVYTGSVTRACRVCCHVYHNGCLQKIGQDMDSAAVIRAQQDMWACHQCSDISRLLTREETHYVSTCLEDLGIDPDYLRQDDYIRYKEKMSETLRMSVTDDFRNEWRRRFQDLTGKEEEEALDWSQFLQLESISLLRNRCKDSLVRLMTDSEFTLARKLYKGINAGNDVTFQQVLDCVFSLYNKFHLPVPQDNPYLVKTDQDDISSCICWSEFLRFVAIHIVAVRQPPSSSSDAANYDNRSGALTPSFDSIDDEDYRTCDSDLDNVLFANNKQDKIAFENLDPLKTVRTLSESDDEQDVKSLSLLEGISKSFQLEGSARNINEVIENSRKSLDNFSSTADKPETRPANIEKITSRRSEILVRPTTEEGRSPRRPLSQKVMAPTFEFVNSNQKY